MMLSPGDDRTLGTTGRVGLHATPDLDALKALRSFAPLASPVICETRGELFDMLDTAGIELAFLALGDYRSGTVIDSYETLWKRDVAIVGEHLLKETGTRFLLLAKGHRRGEDLSFAPGVRAGEVWLDQPVLAPGRTSVLFSLPDQPGALVRALGAVSRRHLNLTKLEMRPSGGDTDECQIVADIEGYAYSSPVREALAELNRLAGDVRVLGAYPAGV